MSKLAHAMFELQKVFNEFGHPELIVFQFSTRSQKEHFYKQLLMDDEEFKTLVDEPGVTIRVANQKVQLRERINT